MKSFESKIMEETFELNKHPSEYKEGEPKQPILKFKGSIRYIQKWHPTLGT